jgi:hypothetical protein
VSSDLDISSEHPAAIAHLLLPLLLQTCAMARCARSLMR